MGKNIDQLRQQLVTAERKAREYLAGQVHQYHFADAAIGKCSTDKMTASGVILTITSLGGAQIVEPVLMRGGISNETIEAIRADFRRSYQDAVAFKPKGVL